MVEYFPEFVCGYGTFKLGDRFEYYADNYIFRYELKLFYFENKHGYLLMKNLNTEEVLKWSTSQFMLFWAKEKLSKAMNEDEIDELING